MDKNRVETYHDNSNEYKADINALRFRLMREGVYDPMNQEFNKEHLNKIKSNTKLLEDPIIQRFLRLSKDEDAAVKAMNSITQVNTKNKRNNVQYAATGGDIGVGLQKAAPGLMSVPGYGPLLALGAYALGDSMSPQDRPRYGSPGLARYNYGGPILPPTADSIPNTPLTNLMWQPPAPVYTSMKGEENLKTFSKMVEFDRKRSQTTPYYRKQ